MFTLYGAGRGSAPSHRTSFLAHRRCAPPPPTEALNENLWPSASTTPGSWTWPLIVRNVSSGAGSGSRVPSYPSVHPHGG